MRVWFLSNFLVVIFLFIFLIYVILKDTGDITGNGVRASWFRFVLSFPILLYSVLGRVVFLCWGHYSHDGDALLGGVVSSMMFQCVLIVRGGGCLIIELLYS